MLLRKVKYFNKSNNTNLKLEYIDNVLNNENSQFKIFLIPGNNEEKNLIINTYISNQLGLDFQFCEEDSNLKMIYTKENGDNNVIIVTNDNNPNIKKQAVHKGNNIYKFTSNKPVIFIYSYHDNFDDYINKEENKFQREILTILEINEVKAKYDAKNIIQINFTANYLQSSTRYIIIISQNNYENSLEYFKNHCNIVGLLNENNKDVKIETIYDIGETNEIISEIDISDILKENNFYIINIISQELRYNKKTNFYEPYLFKYSEKVPDEENNDYIITLALAICIPIICILFIIIVILLFKRKRINIYSSEEIEKLTDEG